MNRTEVSKPPDWEDPEDAPDLSQPDLAEKLDKIPVRRGRVAQDRPKALADTPAQAPEASSPARIRTEKS